MLGRRQVVDIVIDRVVFVSLGSYHRPTLSDDYDPCEHESDEETVWDIVFLVTCAEWDIYKE